MSNVAAIKVKLTQQTTALIALDNALNGLSQPELDAVDDSINLSGESIEAACIQAGVSY